MAATVSKQKRAPIPLNKRKIWWTAAQFGRAIGESTDTARKRLADSDALVWMSGRWRTSRALIKKAFPSDWPEVLAALDLLEED